MKIKQLFDDLFKGVKFDKKLSKEIYKYQFQYLVSDHDRSEFFGSALIGVVNVYFTDPQVNMFFNKVILIDRLAVKNSLHLAPAINTSFAVTGDSFNLVLFYMAHRFLNSTLSTKLKERAAFDCILIFNYRTIAALHSKGFKWLGSKELSATAFEAMSNKFILKQLGNWNKYMEYRATSVLDPKLTNRKPIASMRSDDEFLKAIADAQNRIRSTFKIMYRQREAWREEGASIATRSILKTNSEGDAEVAEQTSGIGNRIERTVQRAMTASDFLDRRVIKIVHATIPGISYNLIHKYLTDLSDKTLSKEGPGILQYYRDVLAYNYEQIRLSPSVSLETDPGTLIQFIKGLLNSSRTTDATLIELRERGYDIAKSISGKRDSQLLSRLRQTMNTHIFVLSFMK